MRGERVFNSITKSEAVVTKLTKKGRSLELVQKRNECLIYRYLFYAKIKSMKYTDCMSVLSSEFFISQSTIVDIINDCHSYLSAVNKDFTSVAKAANEFPFFNWK